MNTMNSFLHDTHLHLDLYENIPKVINEIEKKHNVQPDQEKIQKKYLRLKDKHQDKSPEWWFDTHGIDIKELDWVN